jgi:hypothetical protein
MDRRSNRASGTGAKENKMNELKKLIRFAPKQTQHGWTVVRLEGSKQTGRTEHDIGMPKTYTLAQAQVCADSCARDYARHGLNA